MNKMLCPFSSQFLFDNERLDEFLSHILSKAKERRTSFIQDFFIILAFLFPFAATQLLNVEVVNASYDEMEQKFMCLILILLPYIEADRVRKLNEQHKSNIEFIIDSLSSSEFCNFVTEQIIKPSASHKRRNKRRKISTTRRWESVSLKLNDGQFQDAFE